VKVLVDTSVWSLALRRTSGALSPGEARERRKLAALIEENLVEIIGPIRQELLSGFREETQFRQLRDHLRLFADAPLETEDFEEAAHIHNQCRAAGIAGSAVDYLVCAVAARRKWQIFTLDRDFERYARCVKLALVQHRGGDVL
jgi:predicted nucleic acid-binding protein